MSGDNLERNLGLIEVIAISMGSMIGSGIFILPGVAYLEVGSPSVALAFLVGGILTIPTALSAAEMSTAMPQSGGSYLYIEKGMGPLLGTISGIGNWLVLNFKTALALIGGIPYLIFLIPAIENINLFGFEPIIILSVLLTVLFTLINAFSSESAGKAQNIIVGIMMVALLMLIIGSSPQLIKSNPASMFNLGGISFVTTISLVFISYAGVIKVTSVAEEIKNPGENIPKGIIISLAITTLIYVIITYITVYTLDISYLAENVPLSEGGLTTEGEGAIIALVAQETIGQIGAIIVVISALLALASTANSGILSASRYPYAMSQDNLAPPKFKHISNKYSTPIYSILATGLLVIIMVLFFPIDSVARFGGAFQIIVFILVNVSLIGFREVDIDYYEPDYFSPLYPYLQIFGILSGLILLTQMGIVAAIGSLIIVLISILYYKYYVSQNIEKEGEIKEEIRENKKNEIFSDKASLYYNISQMNILIALRDDYSDEIKNNIIKIAKSLSNESVDSNIHVVHFTDQPRKTLSESRPNISEPTPEWVESYSNINYKSVGSQNTNKSIVEYATYHNIDLILHNNMKKKQRFRSINKDIKWVIENSPCESLVIDSKGTESIEKISIVSTKTHFKPTKLFIADIMCESHNALLQVISLVDIDTPDSKLDHIERYHNEIRNISKSKIDMNIIKTDNKIDEARKITSDSDIVIIDLDISTIRKRYFKNESIDIVSDLDTTVIMLYSEYDLEYNTIYKRILAKYIFRGF